MDLYQQKNFDSWLSEEVKTDILRELHEKWNNITEGNCVFISALEKINLEELRNVILQKVRDMYTIRYPYKTMLY
jgi:GTP-binding protein HflX